MFRKITMAAAIAAVSLSLVATGASAAEKDVTTDRQAASATLLLAGWGCPIGGGGWGPGGPGWGPGGPGGPGPNGADLQGTELDSDGTVNVVEIELPE